MAGVDEPPFRRDKLPRLAIPATANADLGEALRQHQPLAHSFVHPGAVAAGLGEVVFPGVAMGVKMNNCQWLAFEQRETC